MLFDNTENDRVLPVWENGKVNSDLPSELGEFFGMFDVNPEFVCTVQSFANESYFGRPVILGEYRGELPNFERLVKISGPKCYRYKIAYKENGIPKIQNIDINLTSKNWETLAKAGDRERAQQRKAEIKEDMEEKNALMAYGNVNTKETQSLGEILKEIGPLLDIVKGKNSDNSDGMMSPTMMFFMKMQQDSNDRMMQMFNQMNKNQSDLTLTMLGNSRENNNSDKLFTMAEKMLNFRNLCSPKEEGLIEKVGILVADNLSVIMDLLSKPKEVRERDTGYKKIMTNNKIDLLKKKIKENESFANKLIQHLDQKLGSDTTDKIMTGFMSYEREPVLETVEDVSSSEITEKDFE